MNRIEAMAAMALAGCLAHGAASAAIGADAAQDLAKKSGLWKQLEATGAQVTGGMQAAMDKQPTPLPADRKAALVTCTQAAYAAEPLRATAVDAIAGALQPADVPPLLAWYDSALGRRVSGMEETSSAQVLDPQERVRLGNEALAGASGARKAAIQAILVETHSVDIMADVLIEMATAVQQGVASAEAAASTASPADIRAHLAGRRPQIVAHYAQMAQPAYAFTYAGLGDDELKQYADYLGTPAARAFNEAALRGTSRALSAGSVKFGRCLKDAGAAPANRP